MKKSFIYFLVDADESKARFKIGQSIDPYRRHKSLAQECDLDKSWQIEVDAKDARQLEREIHDHYSKHRISPDEFGYVCGKTEWFRIECLPDLLEQVQSPANAALFGKPAKVERQNRSVTLFLPDTLYRRIRLAKLNNDTSIQQEILAVLEAHFSEPMQGPRGMI